MRDNGDRVMAMAGLGTFSDEMTISELQAVPVRTDLPPEQLALIGCGVTTGIGAALNTAKVEPGSSVAVIGCGGVGQAVIQGARIAGAARIFAVDPVALKRALAAANGATDLVDPGAVDPVQQVKDATGGRGADFSFEVIGLPETILQAYQTARAGGTVVVVGMPRVEAIVTMPAFSLFADEKKLCGCMYGSSQVRVDFQRYIDLVETGRLDIESMVTRRIKITRSTKRSGRWRMVRSSAASSSDPRRSASTSAAGNGSARSRRLVSRPLARSCTGRPDSPPRRRRPASQLGDQRRVGDGPRRRRHRPAASGLWPSVERTSWPSSVIRTVSPAR